MESPLTVQLTTIEKVNYEKQATGESTYEFFCRAYRASFHKEPDPTFIIGHVKAFIRIGDIPGYVYSLFREAERRRA